MIMLFACWYSAIRFARLVSASAFAQDVEDRVVAEAELRAVGLEERPEEVVGIAEVTSPADHVQVARRALVDVLHVVRPPRRVVRDDLEARLLRLAANASKFRFGSGMYGRETLVGYQKSTLPAACSSA